MKTVATFSPSQNTPDISAQLAASRDEVAQLKYELQWLKRQLFGRKSEKQVIDNPDQSSLFAINSSDVALDTPKKQIKAHTCSSKKQTSEDDMHDNGLRFSSDVPQKIIDVPSPELEGDNADQYEVMGMTVQFKNDNQTMTGVLLKKNRKTVVVAIDNSKKHYTMPAGMVTPVLAMNQKISQAVKRGLK